MILITHSVVGAALARYVPSALLAFLFGIVSHYVLDRIPHWHYHVPHVKKATLAPFGKKSFSFSRAVAPDVAKVAFDFAVGLAISLYFFSGDIVSIFLGSFGAVLPDLLVGAAKLWPQRLLVAHDKFHRRNHTLVRLDDQPLLGIGSQAALVVLVILLFR